MPNEATTRVVEAVARHFFLVPGDVFSRRRDYSLALARQISMFVLREYQHPRPSFPEIAREFGRDHTTVMHAVSRCVALAVDDEHIRAAIEVGRLALESVTVDEEIERLQLLRKRERLLDELRSCERELMLDYESTTIGAAE